jgi:hypothetical protein
VPRCDKTAATRQDKAIHILTAARCAYAARSRQFRQEHVGGDIRDRDVRCARDCEAGIARQQHFSLAALARDAINGKRSETPCNGTALNMRIGRGLCSLSPTLDR